MNKIFNNLKIPVISVLIGLVIGGIILFLSGYNPITGYIDMITSTFSPGQNGKFVNLADVVNTAIPLMLCGFSIAFAYKVGLFNIGAEGQFMVGMVCAIFVGTLQVPEQIAFLHPILSMLAGVVGGAIWGLVPGVLKAVWKVNEVVVSILMNLIAIKGIDVIIQKWFHHAEKSTFTPSIQESSKIFIFNSEFTMGIFVVVIVALLFSFIYKKTKLGYELKAVGYNPRASKYAGINDKKRTIQTLVIAGAIAGIAGAIYGLELGEYSTNGSQLNYGFNGIVVCMLGNVSAIGTIISGFLIALFSVGAKFIHINLEAQIGDIIVAVIFICSAVGMVISQRRKNKGDK